MVGEASSTSVDMFYEFRVIACFPPEDLQWRDSVWAAAMFSSGGGVGKKTAIPSLFYGVLAFAG